MYLYSKFFYYVYEFKDGYPNFSADLSNFNCM